MKHQEVCTWERVLVQVFTSRLTLPLAMPPIRCWEETLRLGEGLT